MKTVVLNETSHRPGSPADAVACVTPREASPDDVPDLRRRKLLLPLSAAAQGMDDEPGQASLSAVQKAPHLALADAVRQCSAEGTVLDERSLLAPPFALEQSELTSLLEQLNADVDCHDITAIAHPETRYYYSEQHMSGNFARILVFTHEQDACATLAQTVRFECQTYPRPYKVSMLALSPYRFDQDKIASTLQFLALSDAYRDIHHVEASNGEAYLFSDRFMSVVKAQGLCEWIEVEQYENP